MSALIQIQNVSKSFRNVQAVRHLSLEIHQGEYVALLGPNGAGKTTLIEMIEGLQHPDEGSIRIMDTSWAENPEKLHHAIGLSLQETNFADKVTVEEMLKLFAAFYKLPDARCEEVMDMINLVSKRKAYVSTLSGGQRQRLALGLALLNKPKILLLDEPTTGLDPTARREIWYILEKLRQQENTSMILTTHYMEEAEYLCDRILIMDKGQFLAEGTLAELTAKHGEGDIIEFLLDGPLEGDMQELTGLRKLAWLEGHTQGRLHVSSIAESLPALLDHLKLNNIKVKELESRKMTLDDLFISMTGRRLQEAEAIEEK